MAGKKKKKKKSMYIYIYTHIQYRKNKLKDLVLHDYSHVWNFVKCDLIKFSLYLFLKISMFLQLVMFSSHAFQSLTPVIDIQCCFLVVRAYFCLNLFLFLVL